MMHRRSFIGSAVAFISGWACRAFGHDMLLNWCRIEVSGHCFRSDLLFSGEQRVYFDDTPMLKTRNDHMYGLDMRNKNFFLKKGSVNAEIAIWWENRNDVRVEHYCIAEPRFRTYKIDGRPVRVMERDS